MFSLVIPIYKNRENLPDLMLACKQIQASLNLDCEFVFVIDGSPDESYAYLKEELPRVKLNSQLLFLSKNFGSFPAIMAGLSVAEGQCIGVMAADLQEPPEFVVEALKILQNDNADVCLGTRTEREDGFLTNFSSKLFWGIYRKFINDRVPKGGVDVFALNRKALNELVTLRESNSSLVGLLTWIGFRVVEVPYARRKREFGKSAWTFKKKMKYLFDSMYSFSDLPIRLLFGIGIFGVLASVVFSLVVLWLKFTGNVAVPGYSATAILITFFGSLQVFALSIIGSYTWRAFENTKRRPNYIVADRFKFSKGD